MSFRENGHWGFGMDPRTPDAMGSGAPVSEGANAKYYWHVLLERRWLVITTFVVVIFFGLIYLFNTVPISEAIALVQIDSEDPEILDGSPRYVSDARRSTLLNTEQKKVLSRTLIQRAIERLDLKSDPIYRDHVDIAQAVANNINVKPIRLTQLMSVGIEHPDSKQAARIANIVVEEFIKLNKETKAAKLSDLHFYLEDEVRSTKEKLNVSRQRMQDNRESYITVSLEKDQDIALSALTLAQLDFAKAEAEEAMARSIAEEIKSKLDDGTPLENIPQIAKNTQTRRCTKR